MPKETGFITPDNQIILLNYDEVYKFCMDVCELEENYEKEQGNHETTANTILNQLLITNPEVLKLLDDRQYAVSLLVEHFGFIRTVTYDDYSILIGHEKILPDILVLIKDTILQDGTSVFYDLGTESKNLPLKLKMYSIQLDERTGYNG